jgi:hypothetical protein
MDLNSPIVLGVLINESTRRVRFARLSSPVRMTTFAHQEAEQGRSTLEDDLMYTRLPRTDPGMTSPVGTLSARAGSADSWSVP